MNAEKFIEQYTGTKIDEENQFCDCDLTWETVITMLRLYGEHCQEHLTTNEE